MEAKDIGLHDRKFYANGREAKVVGVEEGANRLADVGSQCRVTAARAFSVNI